MGVVEEEVEEAVGVEGFGRVAGEFFKGFPDNVEWFVYFDFIAGEAFLGVEGGVYEVAVVDLDDFVAALAVEDEDVFEGCQVAQVGDFGLDFLGRHRGERRGR